LPQGKLASFENAFVIGAAARSLRLYAKVVDNTEFSIDVLDN
jgi:hypothetical protein